MKKKDATEHAPGTVSIEIHRRRESSFGIYGDWQDRGVRGMPHQELRLKAAVREYERQQRER